MATIIDSVLQAGVGAVGGAIGNLAKDIRTAITGKEAITADEREKILAAASQMEQLALQADQSIATGQMKINEIEAAQTGFFRSGWRPAVGWVCVSGLGYQFIVMPLVPWVVGIWYHGLQPMPSLDMGTLITLLSGMLGLGGFRTFEKIKGLS
jgi:hypothetical protein